MKQSEELKEIVRTKYAEIAVQPAGESSCCSPEPTRNKVYNIMMDDYSGVEGYLEDADLGLGCGLPTKFAKIAPGDTVIDLGSGAGNDCFVARHETGPTGKVIGIDFTPAMIARARENADKLGYNNVEFRQGDIEDMPVSDSTADVVVSNCVLNLVPNKKAVLSEIYRVTKPGGHFSISDIVLVGHLPEAIRGEAEMYAGCVSGAIQMEDYLQDIANAGFENITVQKKKTILLPDDVLKEYLTEAEMADYVQRNTGIFSITVYGEKPSTQGGEKPKIAVADVAATEAPKGASGGCCS